jgi:hypothetical protein
MRLRRRSKRVLVAAVKGVLENCSFSSLAWPDGAPASQNASASAFTEASG